MSAAAINADAARREYSRNGLFGVAVPQANPIVEPEFAALMPDNTGIIATRLQGSRSDSRNRLTEYLDNLPTSLSEFDTAKPDVVGYACTGSTYLVGTDKERDSVDAASGQFGYPIITSAQAIIAALKHLDASRVALIAPYPQWMIDISHGYWEGCGIEVVASARTMLDTEDTRNVYQVQTQMVLDVALSMDIGDAQVMLLSGTGMPTLRALPRIALHFGIPAISSNLCLAWAMLRAAGSRYPAPDTTRGETLIGGWSDKVSRL